MMNLSIPSKAVLMLFALAVLAAVGTTFQPWMAAGTAVQLSLAGLVVAGLAASALLNFRLLAEARAIREFAVFRARNAGLEARGDVPANSLGRLLEALLNDYEGRLAESNSRADALQRGIGELEKVLAGANTTALPTALQFVADSLVKAASRQREDDNLIDDITKVCAAVAAGDLNARLVNIPEDHRLAPLMNAVNDLVDRADSFVREAGAAMEYVARNCYYRSIVETGMLGANLKAAQTINAAIAAIKKKMADFGSVSSMFEQKINAAVSSLGESAAALKTHAEELMETATESGVKSEHVSTAARQTSSNVHSVSAATVELSGSIAEISRRVDEQAGLTKAAVDKSNTASNTIAELDQAAAKIGEVVRLISNIAEQTNLLALNATIEAARAGDAGRGFAVVANEVRTLATQTASATSEIGQQIKDIQGATKRSVNAIAEIFATISNVNEISANITVAVQEQNVATQEIARNIEVVSGNTLSVTDEITHVTEATERTKGAATEVLAAAAGLAEQSRMVGVEMRVFKDALKRVI